MKANHVTKAAKAQGRCSKCGDEIPAGSAYSWAKARYGPKVVRCSKFECRLRPSDLTSSDKLSNLYSLQEEMEDFAVDDDTTIADVQSALEDWAQRAEEVADEYDESAQNIEDGFGHETSTSAEVKEKAEEARGWAEALSQCDLPEEWDEEQARTEATREIEDASDEADLAHQVEALIEEKRQEWVEAVETAINDVSGELTL